MVLMFHCHISVLASDGCPGCAPDAWSGTHLPFLPDRRPLVDVQLCSPYHFSSVVCDDEIVTRE